MADAGKVLIVDDKQANLMLLQQDLEGEGFDVECADSGAACLAAVVDYRPDVILLDIKMPGMDGIECCRQLRTLPQTQETPILFLTASGDSDDLLAACLTAGGSDFLQKPYNPTALVARVQSQIRLSRTQAALKRLEGG
ncbi:MAG: response regulator [Deltaproteobacteria bacterium]|nr:response regulator [Deltaproteobacteria bacterium]